MKRLKEIENKPIKITISFSWPLLLIVTLLLPWTAAAQRIAHIRALDEWHVPPHTYLDRTPVGGITDLAYSPTQATFYAVSHDPNHQSAPHFYTFRLQLDDGGRLSRHGITFTGVTFLTNTEQQRFSAKMFAPEGIATAQVASQPRIFIRALGSQEAIQAHSPSPLIASYSLAGKLVQTPPLFSAFQSEQPTQVPYNKGDKEPRSLTGLTISPDSHWLFTVHANQLTQDGLAKGANAVSVVRLFRFDLTHHNTAQQWSYKVSPPSPSSNPGAYSDLVAIAALDNSGQHLLTLERGYQPKQGYQVRLYETDITSPSPQDKAPISAAALPTTVHKRPLLVLSNENTRHLGNIAGLALGPRLETGEQLLVLVTNNLFSPRQRTVFYTFAIRYQDPTHS